MNRISKCICVFGAVLVFSIFVRTKIGSAGGPTSGSQEPQTQQSPQQQMPMQHSKHGQTNASEETDHPVIIVQPPTPSETDGMTAVWITLIGTVGSVIAAALGTWGLTRHGRSKTK